MNEQLNGAREADQNRILFCHFPLLPDSLDLRLWNNDEIIEILENYPNVVAYINGHGHRGGSDTLHIILSLVQRPLSACSLKSPGISVYPNPSIGYLFVLSKGNDPFLLQHR